MASLFLRLRMWYRRTDKYAPLRLGLATLFVVAFALCVQQARAEEQRILLRWSDANVEQLPIEFEQSYYDAETETATEWASTQDVSTTEGRAAIVWTEGECRCFRAQLIGDVPSDTGNTVCRPGGCNPVYPVPEPPWLLGVLAGCGGLSLIQLARSPKHPRQPGCARAS